MIVWAIYLISILCVLKLVDFFFHKGETAKQASQQLEYTRFEWLYLSVYILVMGADWLQGPYVYELYHRYGYAQAEIALLFLCGFGSSMLAGTIIGSLADKYGRKASCQLFSILYFTSCLLKHQPRFAFLVLSRILSGISTSILFSSFESWLIKEHHSRGFPAETLSGTFSKATTANGIVAISAGVIANIAHDAFGPIGPFDVSAAVLIVSFVVITASWNENYGDATAEVKSSFNDAIRHLISSRPTKILGAVQSLFESSMYIFVFMWTPSLRSSATTESIALGWVFACFMVCTMIGSSIFRLLMKSRWQLETWAPIIFFSAAISLLIPAFSQRYLVRLLAFFAFEVCCGLFWPTMGTLRAYYIPDAVRSTTMNLFRLPLNCIVVTILLVLDKLQSDKVWLICSIMLSSACILQALIKRDKTSAASKTHSE